MHLLNLDAPRCDHLLNLDDPGCDQLFADGVLAPLYKSVFANHVSTGTTLSEVVMRLQRGSSLSKTTTGRLPSDGQVLHLDAQVLICRT